jgi:DNA polymerase-4/protein ImuB
MTRTILTSSVAACCWIPLFALRCEEERLPEIAGQPSALLSPDDIRRVWQVSHAARQAGVKPGLSVSQAIGLCPTLRLLEADPVHYDRQFSRLLAALGAVSPVVEPAELGRVFVGTDGLEQLYGAPERIVEEIERGTRNAEPMTSPLFRVPTSAFRLGWGKGKFISWVAATRARVGSAVIVLPGEEGNFLSRQPLAVLPLDSDTHRRLRRFGLRTLGDLSALPEEAIVSQFGSSGRRLWRLAAGTLSEPVTGHEVPEPIVVTLAFYAPVADRGMLGQTLAQLLGRALAHPRRAGWRIRLVRVRAELERGSSWMTEVLLKEPSADRVEIFAPLRIRLEQSPPSKPVERLTVEFAAFAPGTTELELFARNAEAAARANQRRALRRAAREIALRLRRPMLQHVIAVEPWSRLPERRYALIDWERE